ncbi:ATP-binding cassette domain-containing protein [Proteiniclasticum sp.]|uniref:ATP-binding cassette domain-containing protein n=1 Tax=Proteiniclasticum sp. TaxID=2053595 RepID=UPI00289C82F2|nr:ATP-binding cassette domain-containing protein [Proteiniclasticum sp.]
MIEEVLRVEHVTKKVDGILRLDNIHFNIYKGEVLGLIPLNSHGIKELMSLLTQNSPLDMGRIYLDGELVNYYEHSNLAINKVEIIDVHTRLVEDLTVADNIFVLSRNYRENIISSRKLYEETKSLLKEFDIRIHADDLVMQLDSFERSVIELVKYVKSETSLIIINEISSYLSTTELQKFHALMRYFAEKDKVSFLYIANHHEEAFKICRRIALMEDGRVVKILEEESFQNENILPYIISFDHPYLSESEEGPSGILEFKNASSGPLEHLSLKIRQGECVTILDIDNYSIDEILYLVKGNKTPEEGTVLYCGEPLIYRNGEDFIEKEIAIIEENPKESMIFKDMSYFDNLIFLLDRKLHRSLMPRRTRKSIHKEYFGYLGSDLDRKYMKDVGTRSSYSLVYHRIHLFSPKIVFLIQPFSNADMYLRAYIITLINILRKKGITVVILAVSIQDSLSVSDRLLTIEKGSFIREYLKEDFYRFER